MKIALVVAASAVALMSGCATTNPPTTAQASVQDNVDYGRVAAINSAARSNGILIQWVHYPEARKPAVGVAPALADPSS